MDHPDIYRLRRAGLQELEAIYASDRPVKIPTGCFRGVYLKSLESPGARRPMNRAIALLGFAVPPFGVDFGSRRWYFGHRLLQVGHFEPRISPSRWRGPAEVVSLHYHVSRLPGPIRQHLYDEVKPLAPDLCLGIGGMNRERGEGELFFFALTL